MPDIVCRGCKGRFHEAVEQDHILPDGTLSPLQQRFDPTRPTNGAMVRVKQKYKATMRWTFAENSSTVCDTLACPECNTPYGDPIHHVAELDGPMPPEIDAIEELWKEAEAKVDIEENVSTHDHAEPEIIGENQPIQMIADKQENDTVKLMRYQPATEGNHSPKKRKKGKRRKK